MSFIQDYLLYNSGNECPRNYHIWSALSIIAAATGRRVYTKLGYFDIHPNLYICLVGRQGFRKSSAKDIARDLFTEVFPDIPIAASVQSREDIVKFLNNAESSRFYTNEDGAEVEYHPMVFFINELKNFLSVNPGGMIDFLTDIYDRKVFDASTIKHGYQKIERPCFNILACETPKWIIDKLKLNIISGGFSRRIIYVYETERAPKISFPKITPEMLDALERCKKHLQLIPSFVGEFQWTPEAKAWYDDWYKNLKYPEDEVMEGYYESKHVQLLKVAMGLALGEVPIKLVLTKDLLINACALLDVIEVNMPKLSISAGRNELAVPQQALLELLERSGGGLPKTELMRKTGKDFSPMEQLSTLNYLRESGQIVTDVVEINGSKIPYIMLPSCYREVKNNGGKWK